MASFQKRLTHCNRDSPERPVEIGVSKLFLPFSDRIPASPEHKVLTHIREEFDDNSIPAVAAIREIVAKRVESTPEGTFRKYVSGRGDEPNIWIGQPFYTKFEEILISALEKALLK